MTQIFSSKLCTIIWYCRVWHSELTYNIVPYKHRSIGLDNTREGLCFLLFSEIIYYYDHKSHIRHSPRQRSSKIYTPFCKKLRTITDNRFLCRFSWYRCKFLTFFIISGKTYSIFSRVWQVVSLFRAFCARECPLTWFLHLPLCIFLITYTVPSSFTHLSKESAYHRLNRMSFCSVTICTFS